MIRPPAWLITHGAALALGGLCAWWFTGLAYTAKIARMETKISRAETAAEHERAEAFRWVAAEQRRTAAAMAAEDARATGEIKDAQKEADRLRDCIAAGAGCGLRVKVTRAPTKCPDVPGAAAASGLGDRGSEWAELDAGSQQAYFALRDRIPELEQALKICVSQWPGAK